MLETALALSLAQECNQGEHKAKATPGSVFTKMTEKETGFFLYLEGIGTGRVTVTVNSLGRLSQHKVCFSVWFSSALTYAMPLLTLVLHEIQLRGWWAGALQALTQFELLCPRALLSADDGNLQSRGRAAGITRPAWPLPISGGAPCKDTPPTSREKLPEAAGLQPSGPAHVH